ncbi:MAG: hypothetical protein NTV61_04895 [Candidatus Bathyarchaeota archaeon]|nr:hypothetical protein [Candidatus Bathyarchaeota archaeon]
MAELNNLTDWFLHSKIFDGESYLSYYSAFSTGPQYPEITSYALSLSSLLYKIKKDPVFLDRGRECFRYMIKVSKNGAIPSLTDRNYYVFDTGIFVSGAIDLYGVEKREQYLEEAIKSADWILEKCNEDGLSAGEFDSPQTEWYHKPSVHLTKLAIPLLKISKYVKEKEYEKRARKILDKYIKLQMDGGSFRINDESTDIMIHPHCYATEGYLYAYYILGEKKYLEVAQNATNWLTKNQNSDGSFYRRYSLSNIKPQPKTSDAIAQATRIWKLLGINESGINKAYKYLEGVRESNGLRLFKNDLLGERILTWQRKTYSWPTFFYIHSLLLPFGNMERCGELF